MTREKAIEYGREWYKAIESRGDSAQSDALTFLAWANLALQSVKAEAGKWIVLDECANSGYYCSNCQKKLVKEGWSNTVKKIKFCPNCGAKMEGADE